MKKIDFPFNIFLFFLYFSIILIFSVSIDLNRHWSSFADQEFTLAYNALLINSGEPQEFNEHPGYFTIFFLSVFFKFCSFLEIFKHFNLSNIDFNNFDIEMQNVIYFTRIFSLTFNTLFLILVFKILNFFSENKIYTLLLSFLILFSIGTINAAVNLRTDLLAMVFLLMSLLNLCYFHKNDTKNSSFHLFFFFLLFFCSVLNKSQTFFFLPCILILTLFLKFKNNKNLIDKLSFSNKKYFLYTFLLFIYFLYFYYFYYKNLSYEIPKAKLKLNVIFILYNVFLTNIYFYLVFKKNKLRIIENLIKVNILIIFTFVTLKFILFLIPSTNEDTFKTSFTNVMGILTYINDLNPTKNMTFSDGLYKLINYNVPNIYFVWKEKFSTINYHSLLMTSSLLLNLFLKKTLEKKFFFNLACIGTFIFIFSINELRGAPQYFIYSDFFLILSFSYFGSLSFIKYKNYYLILFIFIIFFFTNENIQIYIDTIKFQNLDLVCNSSYINDWHKKIPNYALNKVCF
jgi:hypothetical protein